MYEVSFATLSERFYKTTPWPAVDLIADYVDQDHVFCLLYKVCLCTKMYLCTKMSLLYKMCLLCEVCLLYKACLFHKMPLLHKMVCCAVQEMYFRHMYATIQPTLEQRCDSWDNYCALFNVILGSNVNMVVCIPLSVLPCMYGGQSHGVVYPAQCAAMYVWRAVTWCYVSRLMCCYVCMEGRHIVVCEAVTWWCVMESSCWFVCREGSHTRGKEGSRIIVCGAVTWWFEGHHMVVCGEVTWWFVGAVTCQYAGHSHDGVYPSHIVDSREGDHDREGSHIGGRLDNHMLGCRTVTW
jgi:hypothetical protein